MIDEDKLKSKIEGLKSNLIHGACSSQIAMETCCKEEAYNEVLAILDTMQEELASEDLEEAAREYAGIPKDSPHDLKYCVHDKKAKYNAVLYGANWKKEQFEKNRLKHCNSITKEQAELEQGFVDQHIDKFNRMPTFLDAIEYGMNLQKEQMIKDAVDGLVYAQLTTSGEIMIRSNYFKSETLDYLDNVKLIIIKEDKV